MTIQEQIHNLVGNTAIQNGALIDDNFGLWFPFDCTKVSGSYVFSCFLRELEDNFVVYLERHHTVKGVSDDDSLNGEPSVELHPAVISGKTA
jgi:hypothetical protein